MGMLGMRYMLGIAGMLLDILLRTFYGILDIMGRQYGSFLK